MVLLSNIYELLYILKYQEVSMVVNSFAPESLP